jgi:hypothetical protein
MSLMLKKYLLLTLLSSVFSFTDGFSQFQKYKHRNTMIHNEARFGIRVGIEKANMFLKNYDQEYVTHSIFGLHGGLMAEYIIQEVVALQTGITYFEAGTESSDMQNRKPVLLNVKMKGVQVPFYIQPRFDQDDFTIIGLFGAYFSYNLTGHEEKSGAGADTIYSSAISFNATSGQYIQSRIDYGLSIGGGIEYNHFIFGVNYNFGLRNLTSTPSIANNKILCFSLSYMFGGD